MPFAECRNRVREKRGELNISQAELASRAGISRTAVTAIEGFKLIPSVAVALALAQALDVSVEWLFGVEGKPGEVGWAWNPPLVNWRYWRAEVGGRSLMYPVESIGSVFSAPHDGVFPGEVAPAGSHLDRQTLVVACCDPSAGLLARLYESMTGMRMLIVHRSSQESLELLRQGLVHVAGTHLSTELDRERNAAVVLERLGPGFELLSLARWHEGLAIPRDREITSVDAVVRSKLRWVGREKGSGARQCMDELADNLIRPRKIARDHREVAITINRGWADVGVCLRLACEEAGLRFIHLRYEYFDLCYRSDQSRDPRLVGLARVIRSREYREMIGDLPGYDPLTTGEMRTVTAS